MIGTRTISVIGHATRALTVIAATSMPACQDALNMYCDGDVVILFVAAGDVDIMFAFRNQEYDEANDDDI